MLASWVSQAGFNPPQLTVAVAKERAVESLVLPGALFALNILAAGSEKATMKALLKPFAPGESRFKELETTPGPRSGAPLLPGAAAAFVECTVTDRLDAGDHWVLLASVQEGGLLKEDALTAVHHRKSGANY
jgi:flavin reductase (DIM6/NTAB) family NADH-FMN oxidoreductase RutF